MSKFARIIELKNNQQVLLTLNYNNEDDNYEVEVRTDLTGVSASIKLGFNEEENAQTMLKTYTKEHAIRFRENMLKTLT